MKIVLALSMLFFSVQGLNAKLKIPKILGNDMILQQGQDVPIWGWADANEKIEVSFKGQKKTTMADSKGLWKVLLSPLKASFDPSVLTIKSLNENISLNNILVGEVWLCSGQSNMEFAMRKISKLQPPPNSNWPVDELEKAKNTNIRIFLVERKKMDPDSTHSGWAAAEGSALRSFSAVGYFFAKELASKLNIPIGVISAAIPGSRIEPWMPKEAMLEQTFFANNHSDSTRKIDGDPGKFYTTMIGPLIPFSVKGFLWYQGESNCFLNERLQYSYKMKSLIDYWRKKWGSKDLPFYYVQIAPYFYSKTKDRPYTIYSEAEFWEAQSAVLKMSNTAMISTLDLNDDPADLHPVNKWDVGKRLADATLSKTYKKSKNGPMGPIFKKMEKKDDVLVLEFDYTGKGLTNKNGGDSLSGFEVENSKHEWINAKATIKKDKVYVLCNKIVNPIAVRYAWKEDAKASLFNKDGLPALSFRSNNQLWKMFNEK